MREGTFVSEIVVEDYSREIKDYTVTLILLVILFLVTLTSVVFKSSVKNAKLILPKYQAQLVSLENENEFLKHRYNLLVSIPNLKKWAVELNMRPVGIDEYVVLDENGRDDE